MLTLIYNRNINPTKKNSKNVTKLNLIQRGKKEYVPYLLHSVQQLPHSTDPQNSKGPARRWNTQQNDSIALQWQCYSCVCAIPCQKANNNLITAAELKWDPMPLHKVPLSCIPYFSVVLYSHAKVCMGHCGLAVAPISGFYMKAIQYFTHL